MNYTESKKNIAIVENTDSLSSLTVVADDIDKAVETWNKSVKDTEFDNLKVKKVTRRYNLDKKSKATDTDVAHLGALITAIKGYNSRFRFEVTGIGKEIALGTLDRTIKLKNDGTEVKTEDGKTVYTCTLTWRGIEDGDDAYKTLSSEVVKALDKYCKTKRFTERNWENITEAYTMFLKAAIIDTINSLLAAWRKKTGLLSDNKEENERMMAEIADLNTPNA